MEEVIGLNGVNAVLNLASLSAFIGNYPPDDTNLDFPFSTVSNLTRVLEQVYGPHGGRGLALRVGRACFNYGVRQYGKQLGLMDTAFRLLPLPAKLQSGAKPLPSCSTAVPINMLNRRRGWQITLEYRALSALLGTQDSGAGLSPGSGGVTGSTVLAERRQGLSCGRKNVHRCGG
jgi:hypothetical protein